jgi:hypothetical protein
VSALPSTAATHPPGLTSVAANLPLLSRNKWSVSRVLQTGGARDLCTP